MYKTSRNKIVSFTITLEMFKKFLDKSLMNNRLIRLSADFLQPGNHQVSIAFQWNIKR